MTVESPEWPKPGDRIELTDVPPDYARFALTAGARGTVECVDSLGTIHVRWDTLPKLRIGIIAEAADMIRPATDVDTAG